MAFINFQNYKVSLNQVGYANTSGLLPNVATINLLGSTSDSVNSLRYAIFDSANNDGGVNFSSYSANGQFISNTFLQQTAYQSSNAILLSQTNSGGTFYYIISRQTIVNQTPSERFTLANDGSEGTFILCFVTGTLITTTKGEVSVERLCVGDHVVTATGEIRPIAWIGCRRLSAGEGALPHNQQPVRIRAGAFGSGLPHRDLRLSPGHPVLVGADEDGEGGHLVPVMCLINGTSIVREPVASVTYWHVELNAHDVLLAEGLAAESYYDMGSRAWFAGEDGPLVDPDFVPAGEHGRCRPVAVDGPVVEAERVRLSGVFATSLDAACAWDEAERFAWIAA